LSEQTQRDLPKFQPWSSSADDILNALSGVVYVTSRGGEFLAFGRRNWDAFACENSGQEIVSDNLLGRNLFDFIGGNDVKAVYQSAHATLLEDDRAKVSFEYRCDAPDFERRMLMSISSVACGHDKAAILYQSQILEERVRVPMKLFSADNHKNTYGAENQTSICSFCAKVAWPVGAESASQDWVSGEAYYAKGGSSRVGLRHGICPGCFDKSQNLWRE